MSKPFAYRNPADTSRNHFRNPYQVKPMNTSTVTTKPTPRPEQPDPRDVARLLVDILPHVPDDVAFQVNGILGDLTTAGTGTLNARIESLEDDIQGNERALDEKDDEIKDLKQEIEDLRTHISKWEDAYVKLPDLPTTAERDDPESVGTYLDATKAGLDTMATLYHEAP